MKNFVSFIKKQTEDEKVFSPKENNGTLKPTHIMWHSFHLGELKSLQLITDRSSIRDLAENVVYIKTRARFSKGFYFSSEEWILLTCWQWATSDDGDDDNRKECIWSFEEREKICFVSCACYHGMKWSRECFCFVGNRQQRDPSLIQVEQKKGRKRKRCMCFSSALLNVILKYLFD